MSVNRWAKPSIENLTDLIPVVVVMLDESGMRKADFTAEAALWVLRKSSNWKNLVNCLIKHQSAIFRQLKW
jgi:hypothetical protein